MISFRKKLFWTGGFAALAAALLLFFLTTRPTVASDPISLEVIGTYQTGVFDESAAEIVAYDSHTYRLFVINADAATVDVLDISDPTAPTKLFAIDATLYGDGANSVAVMDGVVAVAIQAEEKTDPGEVIFFDTDGNYINQVTVGALPDMVTFTPNGRFLLVANEGEPNDDYSIDPVGSITIINVQGGLADIRPWQVRTVSFRNFNWRTNLHPSIRIFGPGATAEQDFEPEYIAVDPNSRFAYVTLQENNAIMRIDIRNARAKIIRMGFKNHLLPGNGLDGSDRDGAINIANYPLLGMYMPDAIAAYKVRGRVYYVTANEGDAREYDTFEEEIDFGDAPLDPTAFPNASELQKDEMLGRLAISTVNADTDGDGDFDVAYTFGARSFSIWASYGRLMYDSGDDFEQITAAAYPDYFNANNDNNSFDNRSDNKGPEPEGVALGEINGRTYAFIGLERIGGIMVYDITNPKAPIFIQYINNRDFTVDVEDPAAGDLGPEGITFIAASDSPNGSPLLVVGNEVSGSTTVYQINE